MKHRPGESEIWPTNAPTKGLQQVLTRVLTQVYTRVPTKVGFLCVIIPYKGSHSSAHVSAHAGAHASVHEVVWSYVTWSVFTCSAPYPHFAGLNRPEIASDFPEVPSGNPGKFPIVFSSFLTDAGFKHASRISCNKGGHFPTPGARVYLQSLIELLMGLFRGAVSSMPGCPKTAH